MRAVETKAKLRFMVLYAFSLLLIFVVVTGFWRKGLEAKQPVVQQSPGSGESIEQAKNEIARLQKSLAEKEQAINLLEQKLQQQPGTGGTVDNAQVLKQLADKNNLITSLQDQLKQKDAALQRASSQTNSNSSGDEWKQKYSSLKASYDKLADSEKAVKNAYKTVVDDNKRLIGQLQSKKDKATFVLV